MSRNQTSYLISSVKTITILFTLTVMLAHMTSCSRLPKGQRILNTPYFSIQHPSSWKAIRADNHYSLNGPIEENYVVNLKLDFNPELDLSLKLFKETVESQNQITALPGFVAISEKELNINGVPALQRIIKTRVRLAQNEEVNLMVFLTYLIQDNLGVVITAEVPENSYLAYNLLFNDMIQSFRFK
jgi:hypothetical protein